MNAITAYSEAIKKVDEGEITVEEYERLIKVLRDVEPVRHGRWIYHSPIGDVPYCECSECGKHIVEDYNFCPICGADMRWG